MCKSPVASHPGQATDTHAPTPRRSLTSVRKVQSQSSRRIFALGRHSTHQASSAKQPFGFTFVPWLASSLSPHASERFTRRQMNQQRFDAHANATAADMFPYLCPSIRPTTKSKVSSGRRTKTAIGGAFVGASQPQGLDHCRDPSLAMVGAKPFLWRTDGRCVNRRARGTRARHSGQ